MVRGSEVPGTRVHTRSMARRGINSNAVTPSPEAALDATLAFLISTGVSLRSEEGMTAVSGFNPGYFSLTEIEQTFDGFADHLLAAGLTTAKDDGVWQFKRVHDYGDGRVAAPAWGGLREEEEAVIV